MIIKFDQTLSYNDKLNILLKHHNIKENFVVDGDDIPMLVMALNQDDISSVTIDEEGVLEIGYYGDEWQNNE